MSGMDQRIRFCLRVARGQAATDSLWYSSSVQAASGGITAVVDHALNAYGPVDDRVPRAVRGAKTVIDYGLHPTLMKPTEKVFAEMHDVVAEGHTSFKIFMTGLAGYGSRKASSRSAPSNWRA